MKYGSLVGAGQWVKYRRGVEYRGKPWIVTVKSRIGNRPSMRQIPDFAGSNYNLAHSIPLHSLCAFVYLMGSLFSDVPNSCLWVENKDACIHSDIYLPPMFSEGKVLSRGL
jgi:hypothetical protein